MMGKKKDKLANLDGVGESGNEDRLSVAKHKSLRVKTTYSQTGCTAPVNIVLNWCH